MLMYSYKFCTFLQEVAYNGDILKQMVVQGYQPDMSQTLSMQAAVGKPMTHSCLA